MNDVTTTKFFNDYTVNDDYTPQEDAIPIPTVLHWDDIGAHYYSIQRKSKLEKLVVIEVPSVQLSPSVKATAARLSAIAKNLISLLAWIDKPDMSLNLRAWRVLSIESVGVGCNAIMQETLTDSQKGLDRSQMKLISGMTKQAAACFKEYYTLESFSKRKLTEMHQTLRILIERFLRKKFPNETELFMQFDVLCQAFFDMFISEVITPSLITKILLNLEFPYGAQGKEEEGKIEFNKLCQEYEKECLELGDALIDCVDTMLNTAKDRLIDEAKGIFKVKHVFNKGVVNIGTGFLKSFSKYIGGYIFATVNAALRSDESKVLQIIEMWIQRAGAPKEEVDEKTLRAKLDATIRTDLTRLVKFVISEDEKEKKGIKDQAGKIIQELAPLLVELVWDTESRPIAQLLCHYLPVAPLQQFFPSTTKDSLVVVRPTTIAQRCEAFIINFVKDYLLSQNPEVPLDKMQQNWEAIFMCSVKIGVRKAFAAKEEAKAKNNTEEQIMQLGLVLAAINAFLTKSIEKKHTFNMSCDEIEKELVDFLNSLVQSKYPGKAELQQEVVKVTRGLISKSIDTIFDPFFISNLILKIKLDKSLIQGPQTQGQDLKGYDAVGLEAVRLLRTILSLGHKDDVLGLLDKLIAGVARQHKEMIGSKIAQAIHAAAQSNDLAMMDMLEKLLWTKGQDNQCKPIFFDGWIEDKQQLQAALMKWLEDQLLPFVSEAISSQGIWGSSVIESKLRSIIRQVAEKLFKLLWHEENKAIRMLLIRYLLPIFKSYLPITV